MRPNDPAFDHRSQQPEASRTNEQQTALLVDWEAPNAIQLTVDCLSGGGIIALPTDTVYGIAASLAHPEALDRIYVIKGRPDRMPLPVLVSSIDALARLVHVDASIVPLLDEFWPGPLTVVLPAATRLPERALGPGNTVGVRLPNHPLAIEIIEQAGGAIACTSANRTGEEPGHTATDVARALGNDLDLIFDGGRSPGGVSSTVVAIEGDTLRFLREGAISIADIIRIWDEIRIGRSC